MPMQLPPNHLEADDLCTMEAEILNSEVLRPAVENRDAAKMSDRRRCRRHPKFA